MVSASRAPRTGGSAARTLQRAGHVRTAGLRHAGLPHQVATAVLANPAAKRQRGTRCRKLASASRGVLDGVGPSPWNATHSKHSGEPGLGSVTKPNPGAAGPPHSAWPPGLRALRPPGPRRGGLIHDESQAAATLRDGVAATLHPHRSMLLLSPSLSSFSCCWPGRSLASNQGRRFAAPIGLEPCSPC